LFDHWLRAEILAVEVEEIEQKEYQPGGVAGVGDRVARMVRIDAVTPTPSRVYEIRT